VSQILLEAGKVESSFSVRAAQNYEVTQQHASGFSVDSVGVYIFLSKLGDFEETCLYQLGIFP
jgi:hypothetical protein